MDYVWGPRGGRGSIQHATPKAALRETVDGFQQADGNKSLICVISLTVISSNEDILRWFWLLLHAVQIARIFVPLNYRF